MGDARTDALRVEFDSRIKLEFHGAAVTSDAGLIAYRELDEELGLTEIGEVFRDSRRGKNKQHELLGLLRQSASIVIIHVSRYSIGHLVVTLTDISHMTFARQHHRAVRAPE